MGPCEWPVTYSECSDAEQEFTSGVLTQAQDLATEFLWNVTGRRYGACPVAVRPCQRQCADSAREVSTFYGTALFLDPCGRCSSASVGRCTCEDRGRTLRLPGPVSSVTSVTLDGEPFPESAYRIEGDLLIRTDGDDWPDCQPLYLPSTSPGTFEVTYAKGLDVPIGGQVAAGLLTVEMARALCNDAACALPKRVQSITRQGVSVAVLDAFEDLDEGRTGLWLVDSWVASVNRTFPRSSVRSPDYPMQRGRLTWL